MISLAGCIRSPAYLFVGPSAYGIPVAILNRPGLHVLPPAARGDVARLLDGHEGPPTTIVLADGRFGDVLAVGHRELLGAIDRGWQVWGVASMGAVRAAELYPYGMRGAGTVFHYLRETMAPDDEVAVLHGPAPTYRPISEALVDLRCLLDALVDQQAMKVDQVAAVNARLSNLWFGDRTLPVLIEMCREEAGTAAAAAAVELLSRFDQLRIKCRDLATFLLEEPW